jgi:hypothetical protein
VPFACAVGLVAPAAAAEFDTSATVRTFAQSTPNALLLTQVTTVGEVVDRVADADARTDEFGGQLFARAGFSAKLARGLYGRLGFDTGLISFTDEGVFGDGRAIGDHLAQTWLLGETYLDLQPREDGTVVLRAGRLRSRVGEGAIFDGASFGLTFDWDLSLADRPKPFGLRLWAVLPDGRFTDDFKTSPLVDLELRVPFLRWELGGFGAVFVDDANALIPLLRLPALLAGVAATGTSGWLGWFGGWVEGRQDWGGIRLDGIAGVGSVDVQGTAALGGQTVEVPVRLRSAFFKAEAWAEARDHRFQLFFVALTGDDDLGPPGDRSYGAFPSLAPVLPLTAIFFSGTSAPIQQQPVVQNLAPDGAGLLAPGGGWSVLWGPVGLSVVVAGLFNDASSSLVRAIDALDRRFPNRELPGPSAGARLYGVETNLSADWMVHRHVILAAEGAWLATGGALGPAPDAWQLLLGVTVLADRVQL